MKRRIFATLKLDMSWVMGSMFEWLGAVLTRDSWKLFYYKRKKIIKNLLKQQYIGLHETLSVPRMSPEMRNSTRCGYPGNRTINMVVGIWSF